MSDTMQGVAVGRAMDPDSHSYLARAASQHDGSPEDAPEVARELTMLRGAIIGADRAVHEAFQEFEELLAKLQPVVDQRPRPTEGLRGEETVKSAPTVTTGVGGDVRSAMDSVGLIEAQVNTLSSRMRNLRATIAL